MQSNFVKLFAHILLVVLGEILLLKFQKKIFIFFYFFVWASLARNGRFEHLIFEKNYLCPLGVN
jgi:hypothetical protein